MSHLLPPYCSFWEITLPIHLLSQQVRQSSCRSINNRLLPRPFARPEGVLGVLGIYKGVISYLVCTHMSCRIPVTGWPRGRAMGWTGLSWRHDSRATWTDRTERGMRITGRWGRGGGRGPMPGDTISQRRRFVEEETGTLSAIYVNNVTIYPNYSTGHGLTNTINIIIIRR